MNTKILISLFFISIFSLVLTGYAMVYDESTHSADVHHTHDYDRIIGDNYNHAGPVDQNGCHCDSNGVFHCH